MTRIQQVLSGAGPVDAVSAQALAYRAAFERWGLAGHVFADAIDPRARREFTPLREFRPAADDLVLIHYSAFAPHLRPVLDLPQRKLVAYHNVTPARYFWNHHPGVAVACALGRDELPLYAPAARVCTAPSEYNVRELRDAGAADARVVPILLDPSRLEPRGRAPAGGAGGPTVLCVSRLAPNKRHDLAIRAFALYRDAHAPDARLVCVGEPLTPRYRELLEEIATDAGVAGAVELTGALPQADLNAAYASADVLLSLSEHEGFSVPLLEAFNFDVPVVARPVGGMREVGGDAVLWAEDDDLAVVAELIHLAVDDTELRAELTRRGRERLELFRPGEVERLLREAVDAALA